MQPTSFRWFVVFPLFAISTVNYIDRAAISYSIPQIERDLENADLLYMPIPFGKEHENFARYSVSTKMVTYAGTGIPILYHGPTNSAAFGILGGNKAAISAAMEDGLTKSFAAGECAGAGVAFGTPLPRAIP